MIATAWGHLSSQANNSIRHARIFEKAVSNIESRSLHRIQDYSLNLRKSGIESRSPDNNFEDINDMPFTTLLSAQIAVW